MKVPSSVLITGVLASLLLKGVGATHAQGILPRPSGLGFEYFYGFLGGDTSQWAPAIFENNQPVEPPHNDANYFFEKDMADHAIARLRMLHAVAPDKPWVVYYAPGTAHAPHHAPKDWIAKFKGQFDVGWDKMREQILVRQKAMGIVPPDTRLTPRPKEIASMPTTKRFTRI